MPQVPRNENRKACICLVSFKIIVMNVPAGPWLRAAKIWSHFGGTPQLEAQLQKGTWCELC